MYACLPDIGDGFFDGVRAPCNATAYLRDPPPPLDSRISTMVEPPWLPSGVRVHAESYRRIYGNTLVQP
jgi:hypothetical protein